MITRSPSIVYDQREQSEEEFLSLLGENATIGSSKLAGFRDNDGDARLRSGSQSHLWSSTGNLFDSQTQIRISIRWNQRSRTELAQGGANKHGKQNQWNCLEVASDPSSCMMRWKSSEDVSTCHDEYFRLLLSGLVFLEPFLSNVLTRWRFYSRPGSCLLLWFRSFDWSLHAGFLQLGAVHNSDAETRTALLKRSALKTLQAQSRTSSFCTPQLANITLTPLEHSGPQSSGGSKQEKYMEASLDVMV